VGAVPVHCLNGVWGTLAVGIWGQKALGLANDGLLHGGGLGQLGVQALGVIACGAYAVISMTIIFSIIKAIVGLRVTPEEELRGLDIDEHGMEGYADFQIFTTR
jgi:Amt family ammonium transporter